MTSGIASLFTAIPPFPSMLSFHGPHRQAADQVFPHNQSGDHHRRDDDGSGGHGLPPSDALLSDQQGGGHRNGLIFMSGRSEERRVGKECRSAGSAGRGEKNEKRRARAR